MKKSIEQIKIEEERRMKLQKEKPYVLEKLINYKNKISIGECTPVIEFIFDHTCNMKCAHCANAVFATKERAISVKDVENISKQADMLGLAQFSLSGPSP